MKVRLKKKKTTKNKKEERKAINIEYFLYLKNYHFFECHTHFANVCIHAGLLSVAYSLQTCNSWG